MNTSLSSATSLNTYLLYAWRWTSTVMMCHQFILFVKKKNETVVLTASCSHSLAHVIERFMQLKIIRLDLAVPPIKFTPYVVIIPVTKSYCMVQVQYRYTGTLNYPSVWTFSVTDRLIWNSAGLSKNVSRFSFISFNRQLETSFRIHNEANQFSTQRCWDSAF